MANEGEDGDTKGIAVKTQWNVANGDEQDSLVSIARFLVVAPPDAKGIEQEILNVVLLAFSERLFHASCLAILARLYCWLSSMTGNQF